MRRIRVLHVVTRLVRRGVPRQVLEIAAGLDARRFQVELLAGRGEEAEGSLWDEAHRRGLATTYVETLVRPIRPHLDLAAYRAIARQIGDGNYDIVHTHISKAGILGRLAAWRAGVPVIAHTYHGQVEEVHENSARGLLLLAAERWAASYTDAIVAVSEATAGLQLSRGVGQFDQYQVIHNGIDTDNFRMSIPELELPTPLAGRRLIGVIGSLTEEKGYDFLLESFPPLLREFPDLHLVVLGDGYLRGTLQDLAVARGVGDHVLFTGNVEDVRPWLKQFELVVIPSRREGLPTVLLEAMALGRPVVAADVGGICELLRDGESGALFTAEDGSALRQASARLLANADLRRSFGSAARQRVDQEFTQQHAIARLEQLYETQLHAKNVVA